MYDVSSFANASGGYLIFGISEDKGIAIKIDGIETNDIDKEILRLDNILRDGASPRIPGIRIQPIQLQNNNYVIIIDIPRSFALPHMVTYKNSSRFYSRNSGGKYQLNVDEIRTAFTVSQGLIDRIRDFRRERLSMIIADETPVMLEKGAKLVLHLIPLNAFESNSIITTEKINSIYQKKQWLFSPLYNNDLLKYRYNLDGFLTYARNNISNYNTYSQFFRNGVVEATTNNFANDHYGDFEVKKENFIYKDYERGIIYCLNNYLQLQQILNIPTPLIIFLSMVGVSSYIMGYGWPSEQIFRHTIDRDNLRLPEVMIEDYNVDLYTVMKPIFDTVWNAAGYKRSLNYDEQGNWLGNK